MPANESATIQNPACERIRDDSRTLFAAMGRSYKLLDILRNAALASSE
ncbi:MAG: hypothetical protein Q7J46_06980 [Pseudomonas sp.]|nr:hypothetical protein [Pseudomonas sp.]